MSLKLQNKQKKVVCSLPPKKWKENMRGEKDKERKMEF